MSQTGSYSVNLIGSIASNLAGLQGYDVMALELIQNADDAKASSITFNITDDALVVENDGEFSYCGDLGESSCPNLSGANGYSCDFHRITNLASGGKARRSENIGRFGIGFVSTYQLCDHPQISSSGITVTLLPEQEKYRFETADETTGTRFTLPWAKDPGSSLRRELRVSAIQSDDLDQLETDIARILDGTLLFLNHLKSAELRRNGRLIRSCKLTRDGENTILLEFGPDEQLEMWLVIQADANEQAGKLTERFPQLEPDDRRADITVAFRLDTDPLLRGLFYAFLPTEQLTGLPLHINADFYPEPDRKSIILSGGKHQQHWNEMLIQTAAEKIAAKLDELKDQLGAELVWDLLKRAWAISQGYAEDWQPFFWQSLEATVDSDSKLAWTHKNQWAVIGQTIIPPKEISGPEQALLNTLGLELANERIVKQAQEVLQKLGTVRLSLKRIAETLENSDFFQSVSSQAKIDESQARSLYQPLWQLIERSAADLPAGRKPGDYFNDLPILLTTAQQPIAPANAHQSYDELATPFAELLPELNLISSALYPHTVTRNLAPELTLDAVASLLEQVVQSASDAEDLLGTDGRKAHKLYRAMADLNAQYDCGVADHALTKIPLFLTGDGYTSANSVSLPGNFSDPIGFANILDSRALDPVIEDFFHRSVGIRKLEIGTYITDVLPSFFAGATEPKAVNKLLAELADHRTILDDDELVTALSELPLIPTQDDAWNKPSNTYYYTDELREVLGNNTSYWVDEKRLDSSRSIRAFVEQLGLREKPSAAHLADRILRIASNKPSSQSIDKCEKTFYKACDLFDDWKRNDVAELEDFKAMLSSEDCLPAHGDGENWYSPERIYAPYFLDAFSSQAPILPFRNTQKLNRDLLKELGIRIDPETSLVVSHIEHCIANALEPSSMSYLVLNNRSNIEEESSEIRRLATVASVYDKSRNIFLRPNQLFWTTPSLGERALRVPETLNDYRRLFELLGVKEVPTPFDHLTIAQDIIDEFGDTGFPIPPQDRQIYQKCLLVIADAINSDEDLELAGKSLRDQACILNLEGKLCFPDEIAIRDSDWHESYFGDELSGMLTAFQPELQSLYRLIGIRYLSQKIRPVIGQKHGDQPRTDIAERFHERAGCIIRVLHDRPRITLLDLSERLATLNVVQCDTLDVMFVCDLRSPALESPETPEKAHYEADENTLYIATDDIGEFAIPAFNSLLHILATSPTGASIPNLVLVCGLVLDAADLHTAEQKLSAAGFPDADSLEQSGEDELEGGELGELGTGEEDEGTGIATGGGAIQVHKGAETTTSAGHEPAEGSDSHPGQGQTNGNGGRGTESGTSDAGTKKRQKERGQKRRDRLLSYVIPKGEEDSDHETDPSILQHNLTVEDRGRAAVVLYEKARGRDAIPQSQDNPGWDIVSTDAATGAIRYIEVKAIDGEWNDVGVGLSKLQFSEALNYHNDYWLYVVENSGDKDHERVYPIQSPATKVTSFMFDQNWRDIAGDVTETAAATVDEAPADGYVPGAHIDCGLFGKGVIKEVNVRGRTKQLLIDFGDGKERPMNLNTSRMKIIDDPGS